MIPVSPYLRRQAAPLMSLCLLVGAWAERQAFHLPVGDATAYHAEVRAAADAMTKQIGEWVGATVEPPASVLSILRPNVLEGREFTNADTGERATLIVVQCRDARDMTGHWPPVCYPAQGWTLRSSEQRIVTVAPFTFPVTVYRFTIESIDRFSEMVVYNFFARPDGVIDGGAEGVRKAAEDPRLKVFGAAQFQVTLDPLVPADRRDEIFGILIGSTVPLLEAILRGKRP